MTSQWHPEQPHVDTHGFTFWGRGNVRIISHTHTHTDQQHPILYNWATEQSLAPFSVQPVSQTHMEEGGELVQGGQPETHSGRTVLLTEVFGRGKVSLNVCSHRRPREFQLGLKLTIRVYSPSNSQCTDCTGVSCQTASNGLCSTRRPSSECLCSAQPLNSTETLFFHFPLVPFSVSSLFVFK